MEYDEIKNIIDLVEIGDLVNFTTDTEDEKLNKFLNDKNSGAFGKGVEITEIDSKNEKIKIKGYPDFIDIDIPEMFVVKLEQLVAIMNKLKKDRYIYESVKELAYTLADRVYTEPKDFYIEYKLIKQNVGGQDIYKHRIAFSEFGVWILVDLMWQGQALIICNYYIVPDIDNLGMEDIEVAIPDDEQE